MRSKPVAALIAAAALAVIAPATALAQDTNTVDTSYGNPQPEEEDGFPWGLLGLLGLLGLIPRKRHVDVDNRTTTRS